MSNIILNPTASGNVNVLTRYQDVANSVAMTLDFSAVTVVSGTKSTGSAVTSTVQNNMTTLQLDAPIADGYTLTGVSFKRGGIKNNTDAANQVKVLVNPATGGGTTVGSIEPISGKIQLTSWTTGSSPMVTEWSAAAAAPLNGAFTPFGSYEVMFRTAAAPLRSGSVSVLGTLADGTTFNVAADTAGRINTARVKGVVNYNTGVIDLFFVKAAPTGAQTTVDLSFLGIPGVSNVYLDQVRTETLRYNAVAYSYLPLDTEILGIDPVRLPSDGRVPIFRPGGIVVLGHTASTAPAAAVNGGTVSTGRTRLSRVDVIDAAGAKINTGYTANLDAGTVTFTNVTGYAQPVYVEHRIEDMVQLRDAQINGDLTFLPALSHAYPVGSFISSALVGGDLQARVSLTFDQGSWDGITFSDALIGNTAVATYNDTAAPIEVTNAGTETERWVIQFTSNTAFRFIGEHLGVVATGSTTAEFAPLNPVTGQPYVTIPASVGWGSGWVAGNILRVNTVGARFSVWGIRTTRQGPESGEDYSFELLTRGDRDNPL